MASLLLVEDEPTLLHLEGEILQKAGHHVQAAQSVDEAVSLLRDSEPELVVMDLSLPDVKDGLRLIHTIAELRPNSKIIVLSGWPGELSDAPEHKLVQRIFAKPLKINLLIDAIAELTAAR